ncbi:MAG TPA: hypothetical protein VK927_08780, partial [Adhaeribacter sp.]|nr:hypothetical protein [Adhaeribacter sp.]
MKPATLLLLFGLLFFSCKKDAPDKKTPEPVTRNYYPTEVKAGSSASAQVTTSRYSYNALRQVSREDIFQDNVLQSYLIYTYNPAGKLLKKSRYDAAGQLNEQDEFELDPAGLVSRLNHSYVDAGGTPTLHHFVTYVYTSTGKLLEMTDFTPAGQITRKVTYQTLADSVEKVLVYGSNNGLTFTNELHYDGKNHPFAAAGLNQNNLPGNVTRHFITDESNQDTTEITS